MYYSGPYIDTKDKTFHEVEFLKKVLPTNSSCLYLSSDNEVNSGLIYKMIMPELTNNLIPDINLITSSYDGLYNDYIISKDDLAYWIANPDTTLSGAHKYIFLQNNTKTPCDYAKVFHAPNPFPAGKCEIWGYYYKWDGSQFNNIDIKYIRDVNLSVIDANLFNATDDYFQGYNYFRSFLKSGGIISEATYVRTGTTTFGLGGCKYKDPKVYFPMMPKSVKILTKVTITKYNYTNYGFKPSGTASDGYESGDDYEYSYTTDTPYSIIVESTIPASTRVWDLNNFPISYNIIKNTFVSNLGNSYKLLDNYFYDIYPDMASQIPIDCRCEFESYIVYDAFGE